MSLGMFDRRLEMKSKQEALTLPLYFVWRKPQR
jgi:hypothetical protein